MSAARAARILCTATLAALALSGAAPPAAHAATASATPGAAEDEPTALARRAAEELRAARRALADARKAPDRIRALTLVIRAHERGLAAMREGLRRIAIAERALRLELEADRARSARVLAALQAMAATPPELGALHPAGPLAAARAAGGIAAIAPALEARARELRERLVQLEVLASVQRASAEELAAALASLQEARAGIARAVAERDRKRAAKLDRALIDRLAATARSLDDLADALADLPEPEAAAGGAFADSMGRLPLPVTGRVLRRFGQPDAAGVKRPGLVIATPPGALVTAPADATVRWAGPLGAYGQVVILEPAPSWLVVLAGLGRVLVATGEILPAGAPVGMMGGRWPAAGEFLMEAGQGARTGREQSLYLELRQNGRPIDPAPWFGLGR
ncbi:MAG: peptidase M23 [Alphaproteobacteria bacterium]|nr:MAG: peptidase M23 [Alphaproteobacteria bacterium]